MGFSIGTLASPHTATVSSSCSPLLTTPVDAGCNDTSPAAPDASALYFIFNSCLTPTVTAVSVSPTQSITGLTGLQVKHGRSVVCWHIYARAYCLIAMITSWYRWTKSSFKARSTRRGHNLIHPPSGCLRCCVHHHRHWLRHSRLPKCGVRWRCRLHRLRHI